MRISYVCIPWQSKNSSSLPESESRTMLSILQLAICRSKLLGEAEFGEWRAALELLCDHSFLRPSISWTEILPPPHPASSGCLWNISMMHQCFPTAYGTSNTKLRSKGRVSGYQTYTTTITVITTVPSHQWPLKAYILHLCTLKINCTDNPMCWLMFCYLPL